MAKNDHQKNFTKCLDTLACKYGVNKVFADIIDIVLFRLCIKDEWGIIRNPLPEYEEKEQKIILDALVSVGELSENYTDALGDVFMEHISFGKNGQFFTPQVICDAMSRMTFSEPPKNGQSVLDCACGSGRTLLSAAKMNRNLWFYGSDIDLLCVKMATFNMAVNSLRSEIANMDALSLKHYGSYHTGVCIVTKAPFIFTKKANDTKFIQRIKATQELSREEKKVIQSELF